MKVVVAIILMLLPLCSIAQRDTALVNNIQRMVDEDQWIRKCSDTAQRRYGRNSRQADSLKNIWVVIEKRHNTVLKSMLAQLRSYPDESLIGQTGANNFWVLVQHQDSDTTFQKEVLQLMKYALEYNQVSASNYAYLVDRVRVNTGQKQLYGTQFTFNADTTMLIPQPLEDSLNVNRRRQEMGMATLEKYLSDSNEYYKLHLKKTKK